MFDGYLLAVVAVVVAFLVARKASQRPKVRALHQVTGNQVLTGELYSLITYPLCDRMGCLGLGLDLWNFTPTQEDW